MLVFPPGHNVYGTRKGDGGGGEGLFSAPSVGAGFSVLAVVRQAQHTHTSAD